MKILAVFIILSKLIKKIQDNEKNCTYDLTDLVERHFGAEISLFQLLFLVSTIWFFILTNAFWKTSVSACGNACRSTAEMNEMSEYGNVPFWLKFHS